MEPPEVPATASIVASTSGCPGAGGSEPGAFRQLDRRVVDLWRLHSVIASLVLLFLALIGGVVAVIQYRSAWEWILGGWIGLAVLRAALGFWYPPRAYRAWGYRLDARVLETKHGIWFRVLTLLPLSRLQHVDLHRGPLERLFGLASLTLYTAGTHDSTVEIPGLNEAEAVRLRDHLIALGGDDGV